VATGTVRKPSVDEQERRRTRRYPLSFPAIVAAGQRSLRATSRDVSTGGVYLVFESEGSLLPGTELDLTLTLPHEVTSEDEVFVRAHGKTVRVETSSEDGTRDAGVAIVFENHHFLRSNSLYG
jgi:c-di-GMP-binding flagellar brake protein YcgR